MKMTMLEAINHNAKVARMKSGAENLIKDTEIVAPTAQLVRLHMRQTPDGCIVD